MGRDLASAKAMTEAAEAFLPTLSPELRASAAFDFDSRERHTWHYIPKIRGGVMRGRMNDEAPVGCGRQADGRRVEPNGVREGEGDHRP